MAENRLFILDSDHLSLYQRGHEALNTHLLQVPSKQIAITIVSVEESFSFGSVSGWTLINIVPMSH